MLSFRNIAPASCTSGQVPAPRKLCLAAILSLSVFLFILNGCGDPGQDALGDNWNVTVSPGSFTVEPGGSFETLVSADATNGSSGSVDLSLVEPSPSGAPFNPNIATLSGMCDPTDTVLPPTISLPSSGVIAGEGSCTVTIAVNANAPPGNYELAVQGDFVADGAIDNSNTISLTVLQPTAGWNVVTEVSANFVDLNCPSSSVCYAVGGFQENEVIYRTTDGGQTWSSLSTGASGDAYAVQFLNETTGYIGGFEQTSENGYLMKTTDGGDNWIDVSTNMPANLLLRGIHFLDVDNGYAVGDDATVMYTTDGGDNWTQIPCCGVAGGTLLKTYFWTTMEGYVSASVAGGGRVYHTTNGGEDWIFTQGGDDFTDISGGLAVASFDALYSTTQPGASWNFETVPDADGGSVIGLEGVATEGGRTWVAGRNGGAFVAYKEGGVWTVDWNPGQGVVNGLIDIEMFNGNEGIAIGSNFMARRLPFE